jgi:hypothetical protein
VLLNANNAGEVGHKLVMQDIVLGSAFVTPGHIATHSELVELVA